jgi:1-deoxy-D-xylulose-5-phosphate synthase
MTALLDRIDGPKDLSCLLPLELPALRGERRREIVETCGKNGGHPGWSPGAVELGVALHCVFETEEDALAWDVGYEAHAQKLLTGRRGLYQLVGRAARGAA